MKITLELYTDQSCYDAAAPHSSLWVMKVDGVELVKNNIVTLEIAHKVVGKLLEIEELINSDE